MLSAAILQFALSLGLPALASEGATPVQSAPEMEWTAPVYSVGEIIKDSVSIQTSFPGMDLPKLSDPEGYVRGDENIYRVNTDTKKVLSVIPIGSVLLY